MDRSSKIEGDNQGQRLTTWFLWKEDVKPSDIRRRLSAIGGKEAPARSNVFNWVRSFGSGKETAQAAVREWRRNAPTRWFRESIRKLEDQCLATTFTRLDTP
jgi:hypothetical protein